MPALDRRTILRGSAGASLAAISGPGRARAANPASEAAPAPAAAPPPVTRILAHYLVTARPEDLPEPVRKEATRTFFNWVGCAVGGSRHETVDKAVAALAPFCGPPQANVLGRTERFDILHTALMTGISSHIFDYDDTHLKTIIHPAGPVASAILALAQYHRVAGPEFLNALVLGVEAECRIGNAVYPEHYAAGWHITGTCGVFGSAAACGRLLGLDEQRMAWALGIAASQPVGLKISFGSMTKSFNPGRAAQNGMVAALLAAQGYTAPDNVLEGKDGWGQAVSTKRDWREVTDGLGQHYEATLNTYKPFACGIVMHPSIDAAIQLRNEYKLRPDQIEAIDLHVNPYVLSLTGKPSPQTGLEGKFSIYHAVAVAFVQGAGGERQFSDQAVRDPAVVALRQRVTVHTDPAVPAEKADVTIRLTDGRTLTKHIEHAIGSTENPMSDQALEAKFADLAQGILPSAQTQRLMELCWRVSALPDVGEIGRAGAAATA
ncbi:MAG: MmgE/PrpD family protein [Acetobacteraceae bacterium]|nr:MmgE/PrpD family protein [Acetobacteraceae bacterium]